MTNAVEIAEQAVLKLCLGLTMLAYHRQAIVRGDTGVDLPGLLELRKSITDAGAMLGDLHDAVNRELDEIDRQLQVQH